MTVSPSRFGLIGDVHAADDRLEAGLALLARSDVDRILCVGDLVDGPGDVERCVALLAQHRVDCVRGNRDRWCLADQLRDLAGATLASDLAPAARAYLESLPPTRSYDTAAGRLLLCHGLAANDMRRLTPDDFGYALESNDELQDLLARAEYAWVVHGHTHRRMARAFGRLTIVNPGAVAATDRPGVAILEVSSGKTTFLDL